MKFFRFILISFLIIFPLLEARAAVPLIINFQGRLYDSSDNLLGGAGTDYCFKFAIYDASTAGTKLWPAGAPNYMTLVVRNGVFDAYVGDTSGGEGDALTFDFESDNDVYVDVQVADISGPTCAPGDGAESYETLDPRPRIVSSGYAINSGTVDGFSAMQSATGNTIPVLTNDDLILGGTTPAISSVTTNSLSLDGGASGALNLNNTSTGDILLGGGVGSTGCTLTNSSGAFACTAGLTGTTISGTTLAGSTYTQGSVMFAGAAGLLSQDNSNFFWNDTTDRLGLGMNAPLATLDVDGNVRSTGKTTAELTGDIDPAASTTVTGSGTLFLTELIVGDRITVTGETRTVTAIASDTSLTVDTAFTDNANDTTPDVLYALYTARDSSDALKFVINDLGYVGVGVAGPVSGRLEVLASNTLPGLFVQTTDAVADNIILQTGVETGNYGWKILQDEAVDGDLSIERREAGVDYHVMQFERGTGDIGIGTETPLAKLDVLKNSTELVTNGTFTGGSTGWTLGSGWTYAANRMEYAGGTTGTLTQTVSISAASTYLLSFSVLEFETAIDDGLCFSIGGYSSGTDSQRVVSAIFTATSTADLTFSDCAGAGGDAVVTLDDVSVTEVNVGSELATNGTFTGSATGWTIDGGSNWAYNSNNITHTAGAAGAFRQDFGMKAGRQYLVTFDLSGSTAGTVCAEALVNYGECYDGGDNGSYQLLQTIPFYTNEQFLEFWGSSTFDGTIDNVSVKEIEPIFYATGNNNAGVFVQGNGDLVTTGGIFGDFLGAGAAYVDYLGVDFIETAGMNLYGDMYIENNFIAETAETILNNVLTMSGTSTGSYFTNGFNFTGTNSATGGNSEMRGFTSNVYGANDGDNQFLRGFFSNMATHATDSAEGFSVYSDLTSTGGTQYGIYINLADTDVTRWGIYQTSNNPNYFAGTIGIGTTDTDNLLQVGTDLTFDSGWPAVGFNYNFSNDTYKTTESASHIQHNYTNDGLAFSTYASGTAGAGVSGGLRMFIGAAGNIGIGTDTSPDFTLELHDATNSPIFAMSDDDVSHPFSGAIPQTDVFGGFQAISSTNGGAQLLGISDTDAIGLQLGGYLGSADPTDTIPAIQFGGVKSDGGTGIAALADAETVFQLMNYTTPLMNVFGNGHVDVYTSGTFTGLGVSNDDAASGVSVGLENDVNAFWSLTAYGSSSGSFFGIYNGETDNVTLNIRPNDAAGFGTSSRLASLTVQQIADETNIGGTTTANASTTITGSGTAFLTEVGLGDRISLSSASSTYATVTAIASDTSLTVDTALGDGSSQTINVKHAIFRADNASASAKFAVNDLGNVGIGQVATDWASLYVKTNTGGQSNVVIDAATDADSVIRFFENSVEQSVIRHGNANDWGEHGSLIFETGGDDAATVAMYISPKLNVGIGGDVDSLSRLTVTQAADETNIGGTTTANASTTITGSGTNFLYDVGIGDRISLSSASSTYATVTAIASNTSLTVDTALGNGTSQTINVKHSIFRADSSAGATRVTINDSGNMIIGTPNSTTSARLALNQTISADSSTTSIAGVWGNYTFNPTGGGTQVGNRFVVTNAPTSTANTSVNTIIRTIDDTSLANTVRGIEIVSNAGSNTAGVNTGLRATGATFGIQAFTNAAAGGSSYPAAIYAENTNDDQGDILRLYTTTMTTAPSIATFYHNNTTFSGAGLLMDFAEGSGTFNGNYLDFQNNNAQRFLVTSTGLTSMGLGTTASTTAVCSSLANTTAPTSGTAYEIRDCNAAPAADYAEMYPVEEGIEYGDVVVTGTEMVDTYDITDGNIDWTKEKGEITQLIKSSAPYQKSVIGIVSDNYGDFTSAGHNIREVDNPMPVALNGRVPVKISTTSEEISPGDYLTTSTEPGRAMKATESGTVIGKALGFWRPDMGTETVMVYVEQGYYDGTSFASATGLTGDAQVAQALGAFVSEQEDGSWALNLSQLFSEGLALGLDIVTSNLTATAISVEALDVSSQANFSGLTFFSSDVEFLGGVTFDERVMFNVAPTFNKDTAGFALIKEGDQSVRIEFEEQYAATPVVTASMTFEATDNIDEVDAQEIFEANISYLVKEKDETGFTIILNKTAPYNLRFSWIALGVADANVFESLGEGLEFIPTSPAVSQGEEETEEVIEVPVIEVVPIISDPTPPDLPLSGEEETPAEEIIVKEVSEEPAIEEEVPEEIVEEEVVEESQPEATELPTEIPSP